MTDRDIDAIVRRMHGSGFSRRQFLAGSALAGTAARSSRPAAGERDGAPSAAAATAPPAAASAAPARAVGGRRTRGLVRHRGRAVHVQLGRVHRPREHRGVQDALQHRRTSRTTSTTRTSELLTKLQGGGTGPVRHRRADGRVRQAMVDEGYIAKLTWSTGSRTRSSSTDPALHEPAGGDPRRQVPPAQGLGHDRHRGPQEVRRPTRSRPGSSSSRSRPSTRARSSSSTRRATC